MLYLSSHLVVEVVSVQIPTQVPQEAIFLFPLGWVAQVVTEGALVMSLFTQMARLLLKVILPTVS